MSNERKYGRKRKNRLYREQTARGLIISPSTQLQHRDRAPIVTREPIPAQLKLVPQGPCPAKHIFVPRWPLPAQIDLVPREPRS